MITMCQALACPGAFHLILATELWGCYCYSHFTDGEKEVQRGLRAVPRSYSL